MWPSFISLLLFQRPPPHRHLSYPLIRGFLRFWLLYQRDLHLKKPTVPPRYSTLACFPTNRPLPTCSSSSRLPSYHQVSLPLLVFKKTKPRKMSPCWCFGFAGEWLSDVWHHWRGGMACMDLIAHVCTAQVYHEDFSCFSRVFKLTIINPFPLQYCKKTDWDTLKKFILKNGLALSVFWVLEELDTI